MEKKTYKHYHIERKRAAVEVYKVATSCFREGSPGQATPLSLAQAASGGASRSQIFKWLNQDLSNEAVSERERARGGSSCLSEDQKKLHVGFAVSRRSELKVLSLDILRVFCRNHFLMEPSFSTLSRLMNDSGFSSQKVMERNTRMTTEEVVYEAIDSLEEIRDYNYPPDRILCMDETGLWSNSSSPRTYHYRGWCEILTFLRFSLTGYFA